MKKPELVNLENICTKIIDCPHSTPNWLEKGIPIIRNYNLVNGHVNTQNLSYVDKKTYLERIKRAKPEQGDIVISREAPMGAAGMIPPNFNCCLGQRVVLLKLDKEKVDPYYFLYAFQSFLVQKQISQINKTGSIVSNLNIKDLRKLKIPIIDLKKQEIIVKLLKKIDSKITNNNAISKELASMAKTIYDYWFLQFEFPDKDGKPYKSNGGKMVWNDQLKQEIPEGWEVAVINNILGKYPKTKTVESKNYNQGTKYPIIDQSKDSYICGYTNDEEKVLKLSNAIVFGDHSNKSKYVNFPFARGADGTQIISSNNLRLPNYLLYQEIISLPEIEKGYSRHFKFLKMQNIIIPSLNISKKYMDLVDDMLNKQKQIILENKQLKSLRDFLLPLLMNGQVTIES